MLQAESDSMHSLDQGDYSPRIVLGVERDPWGRRTRERFEIAEFLHDYLVLETEDGPRTRYDETDQRIQYLESTVAVQRDLLQKCLSKLTDLTEMLEDSIGTHSTSITSITVDDVEVPLRIPILVIIQEDEDEVGARVPEFSASGFGNTEAEAVAELKSELGALYSELMNTSAEFLGVIPKRWKQGLSNVVSADGG